MADQVTLKWGYKDLDQKSEIVVERPKSLEQMLVAGMAVDEESVIALAFGQWTVATRDIAFREGLFGSAESPLIPTTEELAVFIADNPFDTNAKRSRKPAPKPIAKAAAESMSKADLLAALEAGGHLR